MQLLRIDPTGQFILFADVTADKQTFPLISLQIGAPPSLISWIPDYAAAPVGLLLMSRPLAPATDRMSKLKKGVEELAKLTAK
jgi:hypothetical protein